MTFDEALCLITKELPEFEWLVRSHDVGQYWANVFIDRDRAPKISLGGKVICGGDFDGTFVAIAATPGDALDQARKLALHAKLLGVEHITSAEHM